MGLYCAMLSSADAIPASLNLSALLCGDSHSRSSPCLNSWRMQIRPCVGLPVQPFSCIMSFEQLKRLRMITEYMQPEAHFQDLTVMPSMVASTFHPTSPAYFMPMMSGKIISFFTNLARRTETTTLFVNVENSSLYPIVGIINCCTIFVLSQTMIYLRLRSTLGSS